MEWHDRLAAMTLTLTRDERLGVTDDFPLRFDVMVLLVAGVLFHWRTRQDQAWSHALWEMTYEGFEESLRNRGVTDMGMGRRMKKLFRQGTGRRDAFLAAWEAGDPDAVRAAVARNVLNGADPADSRVDCLLEAVREVVAGLDP
ncbi:MAG: hypothetical protein HQL92_06040 [Magnetococcales bacterium]|nr:hypothetical protein [Magnetococcales bacterium]